MRTAHTVYRFGPFELDPARRTLNRGRDTVFLPDKQVDVLILLAARAGDIVSKAALTEAAWHDTAVTDNSLVQAVAGLRRTLGNQDNGTPYIQTILRRGYRFLAPVERRSPPASDLAIAALLDPDRAFIEGRAALERLDRHEILRARQAFDEALRAAPDLAAAHIGMATACVLAFESTRSDTAPDLAALEVASHHAREACQHDPSSAEAWGTRALVLHRKGDGREALAAARKAATLEPDLWRHHLRLAAVSWGDERLRAAHRVAQLCPGVAFAYWFMATVFVARQGFDAALEALRAGCLAQDGQRPETRRFHAIGLHLLRGLVLAARGDVESASQALDHELSRAHDDHVYSRECRANTWYAIGALRCRDGRRDAAEAAFHEALIHVPGHACATAALAAMSHPSLVPLESADVSTVETATAHAVRLALAGHPHEAARTCADALTRTPEGSAGWLLPVEPLLRPTAQPDAWAPALALLRERAL